MPFIRINVHNCNRFINSDHIIWVEGRPQGGSFVNTVDAMLLSEDSPETIMERILETSQAAKLFAAQTAAIGGANQ